MATSIRKLGAKRFDAYAIDPQLIQVSPDFNVRKNFGDIDELKNQIISAGGVKNALKVRVEGNEIYLVDGERRLRATLKAIEEGHDIPSVPAILDTNKTEKERTLSLLYYNEGKPLEIQEKAAVFKRLSEDEGMTPAEIKEASGYSLTHIKDCLALAQCPNEILTSINKGQVTPSLVIELLKEHGHDHTKVSESIHHAITTATAEGKEKASRKHLPPEEPKEDPPQQKKGTVPFQNVVSMDVHRDAARSGEKISYDTNKNMEKLEKILEELFNKGNGNPIKTDIAESIVDFLKGTRTSKELKLILTI